MWLGLQQQTADDSRAEEAAGRETKVECSVERECVETHESNSDGVLGHLTVQRVSDEQADVDQRGEARDGG